MTTFDHERLDVYKAAIEFVAIGNDVVEHLPRGRAAADLASMVIHLAALPPRTLVRDVEIWGTNPFR